MLQICMVHGAHVNLHVCIYSYMCIYRYIYVNLYETCASHICHIYITDMYGTWHPRQLICIFIYTYIHIYIYTYIYTDICISIRDMCITYMSYISQICIYMAPMSTYMYIHMYIYTYIYI